MLTCLTDMGLTSAVDRGCTCCQGAGETSRLQHIAWLLDCFRYPGTLLIMNAAALKRKKEGGSPAKVPTSRRRIQTTSDEHIVRPSISEHDEARCDNAYQAYILSMAQKLALKKACDDIKANMDVSVYIFQVSLIFSSILLGSALEPFTISHLPGSTVCLGRKKINDSCNFKS